jgi:hypothetical protein
MIHESVQNGWKLQEIYKEKIQPDEIFKYFSMGKKNSVIGETIKEENR